VFAEKTQLVNVLEAYQITTFRDIFSVCELSAFLFEPIHWIVNLGGRYKHVILLKVKQQFQCLAFWIVEGRNLYKLRNLLACQLADQQWVARWQDWCDWGKSSFCYLCPFGFYLSVSRKFLFYQNFFFFSFDYKWLILFSFSFSFSLILFFGDLDNEKLPA